VIVVPIWTSSAQARRGPTVVDIPASAAGLPRASVAVCHQITTLDRGKLSKPIGRMSPDAMRQIERAVKSALDID